MKRGLLLVLSGPSGVGKGTVRKYLEADPSLKLAYSTSITTRKPRAGEVDGTDYFFVTPEEFEKAEENGELLESAEFVGNRYGTPMKEVNRLRDEGKNVLLEIEVQGAMQVQEKCPDALCGRKSEPEEIIKQRLAKAAGEIKTMNRYKYIVCNEDPKLAADLIAAIIRRGMESDSLNAGDECGTV